MHEYFVCDKSLCMNINDDKTLFWDAIKKKRNLVSEKEDRLVGAMTVLFRQKERHIYTNLPGL